MFSPSHAQPHDHEDISRGPVVSTFPNDDANTLIVRYISQRAKELWENVGIMGLDVIEMKLVPCNGDDDDDDDDDDV